MTPIHDRYARQIQFEPFGADGQQRLGEATVLVCGCGALGSVLAETLCRAGVGKLRLIDSDRVAWDNLPRQVLFDETDAEQNRFKVDAAAKKLATINSLVEIEPIVTRIDAANIGSLCDGVDLIVDGTDNFETRFLMNCEAVARRLPWVYGGCVGAEGQVLAILPGRSPCLECLMPELPSPAATPTAATVGVLGPIVRLIASLEAIEAIKILSGNHGAVNEKMTVVDLWKNRFRQIDVGRLRQRTDCPVCGAVKQTE